MADQAPAQEGTPAPEVKKRRLEEGDHIVSDHVKMVQRLLESREKKALYVLTLQGKLNQGEVMVENEQKKIEKEAERKRISLKLEQERVEKEFEERFTKIFADERAEIAALRADVEKVRQAFLREQKSLGQINTQIGRELVKMGVIALSPEPDAVEPSVKA